MDWVENCPVISQKAIAILRTSSRHVYYRFSLDAFTEAWVGYVSVIARSQHVSEFCEAAIPSTVIRDLEEAHAAYQSRGVVREDLVQDIVETWATGSTRSLLEPAFNPTSKKGWFIRLDDCSPKDSLVVPGPVRSVRELVRKIVSSVRAIVAIRRAVSEEMVERCILMPWREEMEAGREWRCFVPPLRLKGDGRNGETEQLKVRGISQYRWHKPLKMLAGLELEELAEKVSTGAQRVLQEILLHSREHERRLEEQLQRFGLTFDVALMPVSKDDETEVQLVEVNPFGAMSGCGSCLYHWIRDARRLYGLENGIEVKVTLDKDNIES
ncbi:MAG: hypothetical protein Q9227_007076 [Pyrenula ochraceoflavens]